jgi:hypothetical protein
MRAGINSRFSLIFPTMLSQDKVVQRECQDGEKKQGGKHPADPDVPVFLLRNHLVNDGGKIMEGCESQRQSRRISSASRKHRSTCPAIVPPPAEACPSATLHP